MTLINFSRTLFTTIASLFWLKLAYAHAIVGKDITTTITATVTTTVIDIPRTLIVFSSGQPPTATAELDAYERRDGEGNIAGRAISTITVTETITTTDGTTTSTVYPCATPIPTLTPTLPYGVASGGEYETDGNALYGLDTTEGASLEACCNLCWFGLENCIRAWWYSYEGCVVSQPGIWNGSDVVINDPSSYNGTGEGVTAQCPNGGIQGLIYEPDSDAAFRSTGDIAGPCGTVYQDL